MDQQRDEQIRCAECGASFVFSADEAAVFAERNLAPPKRCKECRRARKERGRDGGAPARAPGGHRSSSPDRPGGNGHAPAWAARGGNHHGAPRRYTGDVNEYRSPMQDSFSGSSYGAPQRGNFARQGSGEYRSPMTAGHGRQGEAPAPRAPRPFRQGGSFRPGGHDGERPNGAPPATPRLGRSRGGDGPETPRPERSARKRPPAELFPITCNACGAQAEVPFKPAEGREVFCPTCYRARRPTG